MESLDFFPIRTHDLRLASKLKCARGIKQKEALVAIFTRMKYLTRTEDSLSAAVINERSCVSFFILLKEAIIAIGTRKIKRK